MRACSVQLAARLALEVTTLARLWRVTRADGTVLRFTDAKLPIDIMISPDVAPETYRSDVSFTSSAIFTSKSFANQQSVTMTFILDDAGFKESDVRARLYDGSTAEVLLVDYEFPEYGVIIMFTGVFGTMQLSDKRIGTVEVTPAQSNVNGMAIGIEKFQQTCRHNLFDGGCKVVADDFKVAFTVDSASGGSFVSADLGQEDAHWALGFVKWLTGANVGRTTGVQSSNSLTTSVFLTSPPFFPIVAGDTGEILPGCDKLRPTCLRKYNNVNNIDCEPDVPDGSDLYAKLVTGDARDHG